MKDKTLYMTLLGLVIFALVALFVPDTSIVKLLFAYVFMAVLGIAILYVTGIVGYIYKFFKKLF